MTDDQFNRHMNRLASVFPKGAYPSERILLIDEAVNRLSEDAWSRMVDQLIGDCATAPMLPKIRELAAIEREREWSKQKTVAPGFDWNRFASCDTCWDNGVYLCVKSEAPNEGFYAFRCHCSKGFNDPRKGIPQFKPGHTKDYVWFDARKLAELRARTLP